jgi:nucleotide-binding universal stress UspA family protein
MYHRVLIPLDGSELAETIVPFAEKVAGPLDAEVVLLRVVEPVAPGEAMASAGLLPPDTLPLREAEAGEYLAAVVHRLGAKGLRVRSVVRVGFPATEIVATAAAAGCDLIAMSTHGRTGLRRVLFGSVAESVLRTAPVPVLMVRTTVATPAATAEAHAR